ncbi:MULTISPECIES: choice-of-anchor I family protein [Deinococcus]|uniref:Choice-of-anchor I family protein n=1 Tax=Deinococcus rufus TaxID=2136097 RepID=A0ABV7ZAY4_9DEIO|nr:choice-of-anchor I family protein [Deinococcus sp. AB2017081]WQE95032.1 choice-of-anchor I family protein [Deinococcus sp. AB2017081]
MTSPRRAVLILTLLLTACAQPGTPGVPPGPVITTTDFTAFDTPQGAGSIRLGRSGRLSVDAEPHFAAVSPDSRVAWVTLQNNNAVATVDIASGTVTDVRSLGLKDHRVPGQGLDASDYDRINIRTWPVQGMYMPDHIAHVAIGGRSYLLTANEGNPRDETLSSSDAVRVGTLTLDPAVFPDAASLQADTALGRLHVSRPDADTDGNGLADRLLSFGGRSVSVWDTDLALVADTGDAIERDLAARTPATFGSEGTISSFDTRSDDRGPEPEAVTTGVIAGRTLAFVGLERAGGIMVFDVSDPTTPTIVDYARFGDPTAAPDSGDAGDLQPDALLFIPATDSPGGQPLLVVSSEVSGSVTLYTVQDTGRLALTGRYQAAPFAFGQGVASMSAYDRTGKRLLVVNRVAAGLDILDLRDVTRPVKTGTLPLASYGRTPTWAAVRPDGLIAVAVETFPKTDPGHVLFLNADGTLRAPPVTVGALPQMLTFTPDGRKVVVVNAGEANSAGTVDPAGSVSILDVSRALAAR